MKTKTTKKEIAIPLNRLDVLTLEFLHGYEDDEMPNVKTYFAREETIGGAFITYRLHNACVGEFGKIELTFKNDKTSTFVSQENDRTEWKAVIIYLIAEKINVLPREVGSSWKRELFREGEVERARGEPTPEQVDRLVDQVGLYWKQELKDEGKRDYSFLPQETNERQRLLEVCRRAFDYTAGELRVERNRYLTRLFSSLDAELARGLLPLVQATPSEPTATAPTIAAQAGDAAPGKHLTPGQRVGQEKVYLGGITPEDVANGRAAPYSIVEEYLTAIRQALLTREAGWRREGWRDSGPVARYVDGREEYRMAFHVKVWAPRVDPRVQLEVELCPDKNYYIRGEREMLSSGIGGNRAKSDEYALFQRELITAIENEFVEAKKRYERWEQEQAHLAATVNTNVTITAPTIAAQAGDGTQCVWQKKGEYWEITYKGNPFILKDLKGTNYIAVLVQNPNKVFASIELARAIEKDSATEWQISAGELEEEGLSIVDSDDGGEVVDRNTKQRIWESIQELEKKMDTATKLGNLEEAEKYERDKDKIVEELSRATGLRGRSRRFGGQSEKARSAITQRIDDALKKIKEENRTLGGYLERTIETGGRFAYCPHKAKKQISFIFQ